MNPLVLFDYVFYRIVYLHKGAFVLEKQKELAGIFYLSIIQLSNIDAILIYLYPERLSNISFKFLLIEYFILLTFNFVRYKKFVNYSKLIEKWKKDSFLIRIIKDSLLFIYIALSILLYISFSLN